MFEARHIYRISALITSIVVSSISLNLSADTKPRKDPHYTSSGFFDIHVCNWPNRPPFYMALYSTEQFSNVRSVEIINPGNEVIGALDLEKYKVVTRKGKPEKRVFISQIDAPENGVNGWFHAEITQTDGTVLSAKDFVIHYLMPRASDQVPPNHAENIKPPTELKWEKIEEAAYYQVFIKDLWNDGKLIYTSELLEDAVLNLPEGLIEPGGYYAWKIHARDVNEHVQLGDFNIGSNSEWVDFTVSSE